MMKSMRKIIQQIAVIAMILVLWQLGSYFGWWSRFILPSPEKVMATFGKMVIDGEIYGHIWASLQRIIIGFSFTMVIAIPLGIVFGLNKGLYAWFRPVFEFMRNTPPLALVPMLILWFGIGEKSKIILIILASFFPVFLNTQKGVSSCDQKLIEVGNVFQMSPWQRFYKIILPYSMTDILLGLKLGIGYTWRSIIGAEMIAASSGLGYLILDGQQLSRSDVVIVGIMVIGILGLLSDYLFGCVVKWASRGRQINYE